MACATGRERRQREAPLAVILREPPRLPHQQQRHEEAGSAEEHEHAAPVEMLTEDAAERRTENLAKHERAHEAAKRRLAALVRELVADVAEGERNDGGRGDTGQETQRHERPQVRDQRAGCGPDREEHHHPRHDLELANAVAERTVEELTEAVRQGVRGNRQRGALLRDAEVAGDDLEQRIDHAGVGADEKRGGAEDEERGAVRGGHGRSIRGRFAGPDLGARLC
jgi:hypothetical protein